MFVKFEVIVWKTILLNNTQIVFKRRDVDSDNFGYVLHT